MLWILHRIVVLILSAIFIIHNNLDIGTGILFGCILGDVIYDIFNLD
ncbi:MAG: hypothetical protein ACTSQY_00830 [Candidatus Odinarchaeia archaeon]